VKPEKLKLTFSNFPATGWTHSVREIGDLAVVANEAGFDRYAVADLLYHFECISVMTACLLRTERLNVESLVVNPYTRDTGLMASAWATMSDLSGDRAIFGIGAGSNGATQIAKAHWGHDPKHPLAGVRESVEAARRIWAGERVTVDGRS